MDLAVSPLFAGLATSTLDEILDRMKPRRYAAGEPFAGTARFPIACT